MHKLRIFSLLLSSMISIDLFAQSTTSSPYSRFGMGSLSESISPDQSAIGGTSVVYSDEHTINFNNPATYSSVKTKSFLLSTSLVSHSSVFSTNSLNQSTNNTQLGHISVLMPLISNFSLSTGILPFSEVGYLIENRENDPLLGDVDYLYSGNGGVNNYYIGSSYKITKDLHIGVNISYLFGGINRDRMLNFNDPNIFNTQSLDRTNISGYLLKSGMIYRKRLSNDQEINFGLTYSPSSSVQSKRTLLGNTYEIVNDVLSVKDTFLNVVDTGSITLPRDLSFGFSYLNSRWHVYANYSYSDWKNFNIIYNDDIFTDSLNNSIRLSIGTQFTPNVESINKFWQTVNYRFGTKFQKSYVNLTGDPFLERSISFGLGMPVKRSNTFYNLSFEVGERGISAADNYFFSTKTNYKLIKERYLRVMLGITFKGIWFVKRKYN